MIRIIFRFVYYFIFVEKKILIHWYHYSVHVRRCMKNFRKIYPNRLFLKLPYLYVYMYTYMHIMIINHKCWLNTNRVQRTECIFAWKIWACSVTLLKRFPIERHFFLSNGIRLLSFGNKKAMCFGADFLINLFSRCIK